MKPNPMLTLILRALVLGVAVLSLQGCESSYYSMMEKFGKHKRDLLVDNVEDAKDAQEDAKEQFKTTLERFQELTGFSGGELEAKYKQLNSEYKESVKAASRVNERVAEVNDVAKDLFDEWEAELEKYNDSRLRAESSDALRLTKIQYNRLYEAMQAAENKMPPVLEAFEDQVLFLKHNLNAKAIASLSATSVEIQNEISELITRMERSIAEANSFIEQMGRDAT